MPETIKQWAAKLNRQLARATIVEPRQELGEYVDRCHWSKTGWAVWRKDGGCTCQPAKAPGKDLALRTGGAE